MATKYIEEFASTADFLARAADRSNKLGIGSVSEVLYINKAAAAVALITATGAQTLASKTLSAPLFTRLTEVVTAANVITAAESGSLFFLNSATEFASTLPAPAAGLHFEFIVTAAPSGASYTIAAGSAIIHGLVLSKDLNGATDAGATAGTPVQTITLVDAKAQVGDKVIIDCDGTNYFAVCQTGGAFDAITLS